MIGVVGVGLDGEQFLQAHGVQLLEISVPFVVDAAIHHPVSVLGFAVVEEVGGQRGQTLGLIFCVRADGEGLDNVFLIDSILSQFDAVTLIGRKHDLLVEGFVHILGTKVTHGEGPSGSVQRRTVLRHQHFVGALVSGLDLAVGDGAVEGLERNFVVVVSVRPFEQSGRIFALSGDQQFVAAYIQEFRVVLSVTLAVGAGDGGNHGVVFGVHAHLSVSSPAEYDAGQGTVGVLGLGSDHGSVLGKALRV